ncbi:MAG TPA: chemotaxis protein CheB [Candidatus Eremiobacteraceae bacterium]|nr:chemotaxis protein CheB [Candidatus Eremiobacteraceae bacterium]
MTKNRWARVLVVEDSPTAGKILSEGISRDHRLAVAGIATTAQDAIVMTEALKPDVMTLDLMLPDETGLGVIRAITKRRHLPIIIVTSLPVEGADSLPFRALATGATDLVAKPAGDAASLKKFFLDLNERLATITAAVAGPADGRSSANTTHAIPTVQHANEQTIDCVVVGASTGGPPAIVELLNGLGKDFPAPVVIVQHIAAPFVDGLVRWLEKEGPMHVSLAEDGAHLRPGHAYVAPAGCDISFVSGGRLSVKKVSPDRKSIAPSADLLFETAADTYRGRCAGVLLTGMGRDGATGLLKMRARGARTFGQDERTCVVFGMPAAAGRMGAVEAFAEPKVIAARLRRLVARNERLA